MTRIALTSLLLLTACFSKPAFHDRDAGADGDGTLDGDPGSTPSAPPKIAAGQHHACAIDAATKLWCWGDNARGQLGSTALPATGQPVLAFPGALEANWSTVSAGAQHTCGIRNDTLYCWGSNDNDQSGGTTPPNVINLGAVATRVIAGARGTCAVDAAKHIACWGQLPPSATPLQTITQIGPTQLDDWRNVSLGTTHACALTSAGKVACWGKNDNRQLGDTAAERSFDRATVLAGTFLEIAANELATCGVTTKHELSCVGSNNGGLLADQYDSMLTGTATPVTVGSGITWSRIALGYDHACGITSTGVVCYGHSDLGAMGNGFDAHEAPAAVTLPSAMGPATEIVSGQSFSCARDLAGKVACWGMNQYGETGSGAIATTKTPVRVDLALGTTEEVIAISVGEGHSCALISPASGAGTVKCWGDNRRKQVTNATAVAFVETPVVAQTGIKSISSGEHHTCGITETGDVTCWGRNLEHQLSGAANNPVVTVDHSVTGTDTFASVSAGSTSTCATTAAEQDLYCWGTVLPGSGTGVTPTMMGSGTQEWNGVAIGSGFGISKLGANHLVGWGPGCSSNDTAASAPYSAPALIATGFTGTFVLAAAQSQGAHACAMIDEAGTVHLRCGGDNHGHQIDNGLQNSCNRARDIGAPAGVTWGPPDVQRVAAANLHTCAVGTVTTGRRLYCWGYDPGFLGFSAGTPGVPTLVSGTVRPSRVATGPYHVCMIGMPTGDVKEGVFCWGRNKTGEVGNGSRFHDTPVPVMFP